MSLHLDPVTHRSFIAQSKDRLRDSARLPIVVLLFDNFGPYHIARLRGAESVFGENGVIGLEVHGRSAEYSWEPEAARAGSSLQTVLPRSVGEAGSFTVAAGVWRHLDRLQPRSVAIAGYASTAMLAALAWCRWRKRGAVLISDSKEDDASRAPWKEAIKRFLVRRFDSALVGGQPHSRYIERLGLSAELISTGANVVGNDAYHPSRISRLPNPIGRPFFLSINRFVKKKNLPFVVDCYAAYRRALVAVGDSPWDLVLVGDGELLPRMRELCDSLGLGAEIHFPGFLQHKDVLSYLSHCSAFVHASTIEQWGLVVNEAMAAARPVFVSRKCGCFEDLIIQGTTGFGFDPEDAEELVRLMMEATRGELPLRAVACGALRHINGFSPSTFGQNLRASVDAALRSSASRHRVANRLS